MSITALCSTYSDFYRSGHYAVLITFMTMTILSHLKPFYTVGLMLATATVVLTTYTWHLGLFWEKLAE